MHFVWHRALCLTRDVTWPAGMGARWVVHVDMVSHNITCAAVLM